MENTAVKNKWDQLTGTMDEASERMYNQLKLDGYTKIKSVSIMVLNDLDEDNLLYANVNGTKIVDVTD